MSRVVNAIIFFSSGKTHFYLYVCNSILQCNFVKSTLYCFVCHGMYKSIESFSVESSLREKVFYVRISFQCQRSITERTLGWKTSTVAQVENGWKLL
jgi:hypothetical protein